jgi:A/G-specific adenine glycosylase
MTGPLPHVDWDRSSFQNRLLTWFVQHGRHYPWRETTDPFKIIVAEKLLQQTRVGDHVVSAYQTLLREYPTPQALATANLSDLQIIIRPLGLTYRAAELKALSNELAGKHESVVPDDLSSLMQLVGIGEYSARAVLSFAYEQDVAVVDTNVARIYYRVFAIPGRMPANPARKRNLLNLATKLLPAGQSRPFNLALLDLGALVCTSRVPNCAKCPILQNCHYGEIHTDR